MERIDLTGRVFGKLFVLSFSELRDKKARWWCRCECGNTSEVVSQSLRIGATRSCGCYQRTWKKTHGMSYTRTYGSWSAMRDRCTKPNARGYKHYGGRGITICDEWRRSFEAFYRDVGPRPEGKSIDRIDNDGNYEPANCKWSTPSEQNYNRRSRYAVAC